MLESLFAADRLPGRIIRLPLRLVRKGTVVPILATPARGKRWIVGSGPHSCWLGTNEMRKRRLFSKEIAAGSVVFDIGANVGSYTILASILAGPRGKVFAFEPVAENLEYLRRHVALNRLENVTVIPAAVGGRSGETRFATSSDRLQGRVVSHGDVVVEMVSLDNAVGRGAVPEPDYVKIDVEGGEASVLEGAHDVLRRARPVIFLATHGDEVLARCRELLLDASYAIEPIGRDGGEWIARPR